MSNHSTKQTLLKVETVSTNASNLLRARVLLTSPFKVDMTMFTEILPFLLITTVIFWRFILRGGVSKAGGAILIMIYILFQVVIVQVCIILMV